MKPLPQPLAGVFFDLDGTLADSARDMYDALAALCAERGRTPPEFAVVREAVSRGARAVLARAFGNDAAAIDEVLPRFIELYVATGMRHTHLFPGVAELLDKLEARAIRWGIVSNMASHLVALVLATLGCETRVAAVVGGDTLAQRKPDPAPVRHACELAGVMPAQCLFVGDDPRDIEAGHEAGLYTVAAGWGYLDGADPRDWQPDAVAVDAHELSGWLDHA
jgi:phosphoglycolate phosphatase